MATESQSAAPSEPAPVDPAPAPAPANVDIIPSIAAAVSRSVSAVLMDHAIINENSNPPPSAVQESPENGRRHARGIPQDVRRSYPRKNLFDATAVGTR
jgi:hypothetical protein